MRLSSHLALHKKLAQQNLNQSHLRHGFLGILAWDRIRWSGLGSPRILVRIDEIIKLLRVSNKKTPPMTSVITSKAMHNLKLISLIAFLAPQTTTRGSPIAPIGDREGSTPTRDDEVQLGQQNWSTNAWGHALHMWWFMWWCESNLHHTSGPGI